MIQWSNSWDTLQLSLTGVFLLSLNSVPWEVASLQQCVSTTDCSELVMKMLSLQVCLGENCFNDVTEKKKSSFRVSYSWCTQVLHMQSDCKYGLWCIHKAMILQPHSGTKPCSITFDPRDWFQPRLMEKWTRLRYLSSYMVREKRC